MILFSKVIDMKRVVIKSIIFILIGFFLGNFIFGDIKSTINKMKNMDTYYFLQEGIYSDKEKLQDNIRNLSQKMIDIEDDKYHVYVGITKSKEIADMIMNIYESKGYKIHIKEKSVQSEEFSENVNQFDLLIKSTSDEDQILTIEKVVLANYEEIIQKK